MCVFKISYEIMMKINYKFNTSNSIENCVKLKLKKNQLFENREIFKVEPKALKKLINNCYCKYVSSQKNKELYQDISHLLGLYSYTKDKINIKPYIIINKNI